MPIGDVFRRAVMLANLGRAPAPADSVPWYDELIRSEIHRAKRQRGMLP